MRIDHIYDKMIEAANKATAASNEFDEEDQRIDAKVRRSQGYAELSSVEQKQVMDDYKDNSKVLVQVFNRYKFWKGEQERLSSLLQGQAAYVYCKRVARTESTINNRAESWWVDADA